MSQPPSPGLPPEFQPPVSYEGYGGDLQNYRESYGPQPWTPPSPVQPAPIPWPTAAPVTPAPVPFAGPAALLPPQRPAVIGLSVTLAATASLQWIAGLSFLWLLATAGAAQLGTTGIDGGLFHILNRFDYRMLDGLAWPLYLFPLVSLVLSFLLLTRRPAARLAFTITGAAAVAWSGWWLRDDLVWWLIPAGYVAITVLVLWTGPASRWYRWAPASDPAGQPF